MATYKVRCDVCGHRFTIDATYKNFWDSKKGTIIKRHILVTVNWCPRCKELQSLTLLYEVEAFILS